MEQVNSFIITSSLQLSKGTDEVPLPTEKAILHSMEFYEDDFNREPIKSAIKEVLWNEGYEVITSDIDVKSAFLRFHLYTAYGSIYTYAGRLSEEDIERSKELAFVPYKLWNLEES